MTVNFYWQDEKKPRIVVNLDSIPRIDEFVQYADTDSSGICGRVKDVQWSISWDKDSKLHTHVNIILH